MPEQVPMFFDGALALERSDFLGDWYTIQKAEHDGSRGFKPIGERAYSFWCAERITNADIEGPLEHMKALARAIRVGGAHAERRCAVRCEGDSAFLCSPRNSLYEAEVPMSRALELAALIEATVYTGDPDA